VEKVYVMYLVYTGACEVLDTRTEKLLAQDLRTRATHSISRLPYRLLFP